MTDREKLDAIRAKLERRISVFSKWSPETFIPIRIDEYRKLLYMVEKHLKDTTSDDLEGEINRYLSTWSTSKDNGIVFCEKMARHFAAWQKEQMMKDAVDGCCISNGKEVGSAINSPIGMVFLKYNKFNVGDKVKVIIIKEE